MEPTVSDISVLRVTSEAGRATKALVTAGENLTKVMSNISAFTLEVASLVEQIEIKSGELSQLDMQYADKIRQHNIDLKFKIQENEQVELDRLLNAKGLVAVAADTINGLEAQIEQLNSSKEDTIKAEVSKAINSIKVDTDNKLKVKDLEHTTATAKLNADLEALQSKVAYLETALESANKALDAERQARVEIASKTAQPVINVSSK